MSRGSLPGRASLTSAPVALLVAGVVSLGGTACYRTVDAAPTAFQPGASVRLYLTNEGETTLAPKLGPETVRVEGRVERVTPDSVALVVSRTAKRFGGTLPWLGEHVTVPTRVIARSDVRVPDRKKTTLATVIAAAGAVIAIAALMAQNGAGKGDDGGGGGGPTP